MKIRFLGTAAAEGFPAVFCNCEYCKNVRLLGGGEFRTRSQVLIDGALSVDYPPEAYANSLKFGVELGKLKYILATHSHMDHFYAHDFILRGYKYASVDQPVLHIYGNKEVEKVFCECTAREMKPQVAPNIVFHTLKPYMCLQVGEYKVLTIPAMHSKTENCLLYYIENSGKGYLHLYDTGGLEDKTFKFLVENRAFAQTVAIDCTFADHSAGEGARHMGISEVMSIKQRLMESGVTDENTKIIITHFSHNSNPVRARLAELEKRYNVIAAYDGVEIEI